MIDNSIEKLVNYAMRAGLIEEEDRVWAENALLAALGLESFERPERIGGPDELESILAELIAFGVEPETVTPLRVLGALVMVCGILTADSGVTDAVKRRMSRGKT